MVFLGIRVSLEAGHKVAFDAEGDRSVCSPAWAARAISPEETLGGNRRVTHRTRNRCVSVSALLVQLLDEELSDRRTDVSQRRSVVECCVNWLVAFACTGALDGGEIREERIGLLGQRPISVCVVDGCRVAVDADADDHVRLGGVNQLFVANCRFLANHDDALVVGARGCH